MEFLHDLMVRFPASGVETHLLIPLLVAFAVCFFTSMGGISGAFLLLPFQVSFLGFTAPSVSATTQFFNLAAIPVAVWRYLKEKRLVWPLAGAVLAGSVPGVVLGAWIRIEWLPDPGNFKVFAGFVLLYIGARLFLDAAARRGRGSKISAQGNEPGQPSFEVSNSRFSLKRVKFDFAGRPFEIPTPGIIGICFLVGITGGIYGIGGGVLTAPIFVSLFKLPVHAVAGASLLGTFVTSAIGVAAYCLFSAFSPAGPLAPDWCLGVLFGLGGWAGMYLGARCQRFVSALVIQWILCGIVLFAAGNYFAAFF